MATSNAMSLKKILEAQAAAIQRGEFAIIGQIDFINTARGQMKFEGVAKGPVIARLLDSNQIVLVTPWYGLPDLAEVTKDACPDCRQTCDECKGGTRVCTYPDCGGEGILKSERVECACTKRLGRPNVNCRKCRGAGNVPSGKKCPCCSGTGKQECPLCEGKGTRSTGRLNGSNDFSTAPRCPSCQGRRLQFANVPQKIEQFAHGRIEGYLALGPITSMVYHVIAGSADAATMGVRIGVIDVSPDSGGNLMVMLLESEAPGAAAHLLGGVPHLR